MSLNDAFLFVLAVMLCNVLQLLICHILGTPETVQATMIGGMNAALTFLQFFSKRRTK